MEHNAIHYDDARWAKAYQQAARELDLPPRGPAGSPQNRRRRAMAPKVFRAALRIYHQDRVE